MSMKPYLIFLLLGCGVASAQTKTERSLADAGYLTNGFYVQVGYTHGPSFSSFFDYIEANYRPLGNIEDFGGNVSVSLGYLSRFHRNFALDIGFSIYGMNKEFSADDTVNVVRFRHELNYQSAIFSGTLPIILEFSPNQPVVPYVGVGVSIFSLRLDHYRASEALRDTRTAVGGHFEGGLAIKLTRKFWVDMRGRWHGGNSHLLTLEFDPGGGPLGLREFDIKQNVAQYTLGVDYFFR